MLNKVRDMTTRKAENNRNKSDICNQAASSGQLAFVRRHKRKVITIHFFRLLILFVILGGWELLTQIGKLDSFIFSSPSKIVSAASYYWNEGTLAYHLKITMLETLACFSIVIGGGILIAILFWWNNTLYKIFEPFIVVLNSLPKSALAPLFIVWLGTGMRTIITAATSVAIFGAILSLYEYFSATDSEKIKLIYTLGGTKLTVLTKLVLPANLALIINVMKVNLGLSLVGVIIGEFVAANAGLGYLILYASQVFKLDLVILSIVILAGIAAGFYFVLDWLEKRVL